MRYTYMVYIYIYISLKMIPKNLKLYNNTPSSMKKVAYRQQVGFYGLNRIQ